MANQQVAQPELDQIKEKYKNKTDQESQMKMQQETMDIYRKYNINPLKGCLGPLFNMVVMIAFFQAISRHPLILGTTTSTLFGFNLALTMALPNYVFAILITGLTFITQYLMSRRMPPMNSTLKTMNYVMPFMTFSFVIGMPLAMGLYFLVGQVFALVQSLLRKQPPTTF